MFKKVLKAINKWHFTKDVMSAPEAELDVLIESLVQRTDFVRKMKEMRFPTTNTKEVTNYGNR